MIERIFFSPLAKSRLEDLLEFLEVEWSEKTKLDFIKKLDQYMSKIKMFPLSCPESLEMKGLYRCVVTKQTTLFYRINNQEIEIVALFDSRQNPSRQPK